MHAEHFFLFAGRTSRAGFHFSLVEFFPSMRDQVESVFPDDAGRNFFRRRK